MSIEKAAKMGPDVLSDVLTYYFIIRKAVLHPWPAEGGMRARVPDEPPVAAGYRRHTPPYERSPFLCR